MLTNIKRIGVFFLTLSVCHIAFADPISVDVDNLNSGNQLTLRLEVGPQRYDYRYFEELHISENGRHSFSRDMQVGEFYQVSVSDQPDAEVCSAEVLAGQYSESSNFIDMNCRNRSVTITSMQGVTSVSENVLSTVVNARFRDTDQPVTGLQDLDFDVIQDQGADNELMFSQNDGYFRHLIPLRDMAPRYHWVIALDLSNSVDQDEIDAIKLTARQFFDSLEVNNSGKTPNHIRITLNTFDEELTTLVSESRDIAALKSAINSIRPSNRGADQYRSIISSLGQLNTSYTTDAIETGAVIVFTDGRDDINRSNAESVASARGNKPLHFVAVGDAVDGNDLRTMAGSHYPNRIMFTPHFGTVNSRLLDAVEENIKHIDGSYLMLMASPLKDNRTHRLTLSLADQVSCATDALSQDSNPPCFDDYSGTYLFNPFTDSVTPEVLVYGESRLEYHEINALRVKTLWSSRETSYSIEQRDTFSPLSLTASADNTQLYISINQENISSTVTVTDNNWNVLGERQVFSPGFIGVREVIDGVAGNSLTTVSLTSDNPTLEFELTSVNFESSPVWGVSLALENEIGLSQIVQGNAPQYRLTLTPGDRDLEISNTVQISETGNGLTENLAVVGSSEAFQTGFIAFLNRYNLPFDPEGKADSDNDGVSDLQEFIQGSNPLLGDSDFDGIPDLLEIITSQPPSIAKHQISMSFRHSCVLDDNGVSCTVNDDAVSNFDIETIPNLQNPILLSSGLRFSCAADDNGLSCWGVDSGSVNNAPELTQITALSSGVRHSCAISNSAVYCWGDGDNSLLNVPTELSNPSNLSVGETHACLLDDNGIVCWGDNRNGQLNVPASLQGLGVTEIAVGRFHNCAIASGEVTCWGASQADFGQLDVPTLVNPRNLRSADNASCVDTDNGLSCWGERLNFVDLSNFNNNLFQIASYAIHPASTGICAIDLQGLKCLSGFADLLTSQDYAFVGKRTVRPQFNYTDMRGDALAVRNPNTTSLDILDLAGNLTAQTVFGLSSNDVPVAGDFDGDGTADVATRRPSNSTWYILNSSGGNFNSNRTDGIQRVRFGLQDTDIPVPGDYDGDNITDIAFWRPSNGIWYIRNSSDTNLGSEREDGIQRQWFGRQATDIPLPGDYDGDRISDLSFWRASNQTWYVKNSSNSQFGSDQPDGIQRFAFDITGNIENHQPTMADFDGDGITDMALMNSETGVWHIRQSSTLQTVSVDFPQSANGLPMPADYTGDGIADLTAWDAANTRIIIRDSSSGNVSQFSLGTPQSIPLAIIPTERLALAQNVTE